MAMKTIMAAAARPCNAPRLAEAETLAHREPQVEAATMNQQALQDVLVSAQMRASHPPGFI